LRVEYRWFQSLPPYVVHSPLWAATWLAATRSTGAIHQRVLMVMDILPFSVTFGAETDRDGPWKIGREWPPDPFPCPPTCERGTGLPIPPRVAGRVCAGSAVERRRRRKAAAHMRVKPVGGAK
jgi:hypothetical protein